MGLITRRRLLGLGLGVGTVTVAGGAGLAVGATRKRPTTRRTPPAGLVAAVARESQLIASLRAAVAADPSKAGALGPIRADHEAHRDALQALVDQASAPRPTATASSTLPLLTDLAAAEKAAQTSAATDSATAQGALAALFASISACEAGHVALLA